MAVVAAEMTGGRWETLSPNRRRVLSFIGVVVVLATTWELYKVVWGSLGWIKPIRPDNVVMPHTWDMILELFRPVRRGGDLQLRNAACIQHEDLKTVVAQVGDGRRTD